MARRVAPGQKADGNPQHDDAARSVRAIGGHKARRLFAVALNTLDNSYGLSKLPRLTIKILLF
jgi:hypothetical protein